MRRVKGALALVLATALVACAQPPEGAMTAVGVVIAVEGDLTDVASFSMITSDEQRLDLIPDPEGGNPGFPLVHLSEHLRSGDPVEVRYEERDGILWATWVDDS